MADPRRVAAALVSAALVTTLGTACQDTGAASTEAGAGAETSGDPGPTLARRADYLGSWSFTTMPPSPATTPGATSTSFIEFTADGHFTGSDGCNGEAGTWELEQGHLTFTHMHGTLMGCYVPSVPSYIGGADLVLRDGDELVLLDGGHESARLRQAGPQGG